MRLSGLVFREMRRRPLGLVLSILATLLATAAYISVQNVSVSAEDTLRKMTLKLGTNVLIVPKGSPHDRFWATDFGDQTMPYEFLTVVAEAPNIKALRYVAQLERRVEIDGNVAVLTGVDFELGLFGREQGKKPTPAGFDVYDVKQSDEAFVGSEIAKRLRVEPGDSITVNGQGFRVKDVMKPEGTIDDIRIYIQLSRAQEMYNLPGRINSLIALGCVCPGVGDPLSYIRRTLTAALPEADVIMLRNKFEARSDARLMLRNVGFIVAGALLALCGLAVALYTYSTVARRRYELALLIALGHRPSRVVSGLLAKVLLVGLVGGGGGWLAGTVLAARLGPAIAGVRTIRPLWALWWQGLLFALVLCTAAAVVAVVVMLRVDPADQLRNK